MGRPAKSVRIKSGAIANDVATARQELEDKIRGETAKLVPPEYFNDDQKDIFRFIVDELADSEILGKLDVFVLESTAVAVSRLRTINEMVNTKEDLMFNTALMGSRAKFQSDLWRGCNELCLSPQARAKIGSLAYQAESARKDPLMEALQDDD